MTDHTEQTKQSFPGARRRRNPAFLAVGIAFSIAWGSMFLWNALVRQEDKILRNKIDVEIQKYREMVKTELTNGLVGLESMAKRWKIRGGTPEPEWRQDAENYIANLSNFEAIVRVNSDLSELWTVSWDGNNQLSEPMMKLLGKQVKWLTRLDKSGESFVTPIEKEDLSSTFQLVVPLQFDNNPDGFLTGFLNFRELMDLVLLGEEVGKYSIVIYQRDQEVYAQSESPWDPESKWNSTEKIEFMGISWEIRLWPNPLFFQKEKSGLPMVVLGTGFLTALLLALTAFFAQKTRLQTENLESSNVELMRQIQERQRAEAALQKAHDELEDEVDNRTRELQSEVKARMKGEDRLKVYAAELERSNQALNEFAAVASHDLQEPLRKVIAFGDRIAKHSALDERGKDYMARMQKATTRMQAFITSLLEYAKVSAFPKKFEPVDLNQIVSDVLYDLEARITMTKGRVNVDSLPTINGDRFLVRQLFQNLIGNALKFHKQDVPPEVHIKSSDTENEHWVITVADNGIGFDSKYRGRILKPFQRLHGRSEYEGSGIGLAICNKIIEHHGGTISSESSPGNGAVFFLNFPK